MATKTRLRLVRTSSRQQAGRVGNVPQPRPLPGEVKAAVGKGQAGSTLLGGMQTSSAGQVQVVAPDAPHALERSGVSSTIVTEAPARAKTTSLMPLTPAMP